MIRIDENTYIDDTLVTCAEYQLFIDEMRKHGMYFQPDHWSSYQFQRNQAHEPILGVRQSDANAFCEWLSRETGMWKYRLPIDKEASIFPIRLSPRNSIGYWLCEEFQFTWAGNIPEDARHIDFKTDLGSAFTKARAYKQDDVRDNTHDINLDLEIEKARVHSLSRPLYLTIAFFDRRAVTDRDRGINQFITNTLDQALVISISVSRVRKSAKDISHYYSLSRRLHLDHVLGLDPAIYPDLHPNIYRDFDLSHVLDMYFDAYTLRERIAGRSPAFEGIRLVKERLK